MDTSRIAAVCILVLASYLSGAHGFCRQWRKETPAINMCQDTNKTVGINQTLYLDTEGAPLLTKVECSCQIVFQNGSGTIALTYRRQEGSVSGETNSSCGVNFNIDNTNWGCASQNFSQQVRANHNITYVKTFKDDFLACLGIRSPYYSISMKCFPYKIYYAPDEVVDGVFGAWSEWSACSATCGVAFQTRVRKCDDPAPRNGGAYCNATNGTSTLKETAIRSCNLSSCTVSGGWSPWSLFTACSATCGDGTKSRNRTCNNPQPQNGGSQCVTLAGKEDLQETETVMCTLTACSINGGWSSWSFISTCSATCGVGTISRSRTCNNPTPQYNGAECLTLDGIEAVEETDTVECAISVCPGPVHGDFTNWSSWTTCTATCNGGLRERTRTCTNPEPQNGGQPCTGNTTEMEQCSIDACPVAGGWSDWSTWSLCSYSCGGNGITMRTRTCDSPVPAYGGALCSGNFSETNTCGQIDCPVDGSWSTWTAWSTCSKTCGDGGYQTRIRTCDDPIPQFGGSFCVGDSSETNACGYTYCPIDGNWSTWTAWGTCSKSCDGGGYQTRTRTCDDPIPQYGGLDCVGDALVIQTCGDEACPINGGWNVWQSWLACSQTCGTGTKTRYRTCDNPAPQYGGQSCTGDSYETSVCYGYNCPVDGNWGQWSSWTFCSVTCSNGTRSRNRQCESPEPQNNGLPCTGNSFEETSCTQDPCPVNGNWGPWSPWNQCSHTCGSGLLTRTRLCNAPLPQNGGDTCQGSNIDSLTCFVNNCPVDGNWGLWSPWSICVVTCGVGTISRIRECNNPSASQSGTICQGQSIENKNCTRSIPCPIDGGTGPWSPWSVCSASCGAGQRLRTRFCNNPPPSNGGKNCSDMLRQTDDCSTMKCLDTEFPASTTQSTTQASGTSAKTPQASIQEKDSSNLAAILGAVFGCLALLILLILLIICIVTRRRKRKDKRRPSTGPRSVRYFSQGDDVTVTENELYNYDGETPSHATNALFVGGIPETPNSPGYIPHFSTDTGDRYAVIMDSNRTKPKVKERPTLATFSPHEGNKELNGDIRASSDTVKLADDYNEDHMGHGVENPGYEGNYLAPYDSAEGETKPKTSSSSPSPYDYIDHEKLKKDDEEFENEKMAGDYATLPECSESPNDTEEDRYKRFISSDAEQSPDDGYLKSPKRDKSFEFPDTN